MTRNENLLNGIAEESRRSFMKKGALASGGLALGLSSAGSGLAQDGGNGNQMRGLMFADQFNPAARFEVVSQPIDWAPVDEGDEFEDDFLFEQEAGEAVFANYETRVIQYEFGRGTYSLLFPREGANLQEGQTYTLGRAFGAFGPGDFDEDVDDDLFVDEGNVLGLVQVQFSPAQGDGGQGGGGGNQTAGNQTAGNQTDGNESGR